MPEDENEFGNDHSENRANDPVEHSSGITFSENEKFIYLIFLWGIVAYFWSFGGAGFTQFWKQVMELGPWDVLQNQFGTLAATLMSIEFLLGFGIFAGGLGILATTKSTGGTAGTPKKWLGKTSGEWFVDFLLFILAWMAASITEIMALLFSLPTGPGVILAIILIFLASVVAILIAALTFLKPIIVYIVNRICIWLTWLESVRKAISDTVYRAIEQWDRYLKRVVTRVERWRQTQVTQHRRVRRTTCSTWPYGTQWMCKLTSYVWVLIVEVVTVFVKVVVEVVRFVTVWVLKIIWLIVEVITYVIVLIPRIIFFCF